MSGLVTTVLSDPGIWFQQVGETSPAGLETISPCGCVGDQIVRSVMEHLPGCPWLAAFYGGDPEWDRTRPKLHEGLLYRWSSGRTWTPEYGERYTYLCVCQFGHSRSVAMARAFHRHRIDAAAVGWATGGRMFEEACRVADFIVVMQKEYTTKIPEADRDRVKVVDVGKDVWSNPYNLELAALIEGLGSKAGLWSRH